MEGTPVGLVVEGDGVISQHDVPSLLPLYAGWHVQVNEPSMSSQTAFASHGSPVSHSFLLTQVSRSPSMPPPRRSWKPRAHRHSKLPRTFTQSVFAPHTSLGLSSHSLVSEQS